MNKLHLESNAEQVELVKLMGSKDRAKAYEAQAAISTLLAPIVAQLFDQADVTNLMYQKLTYNEGEDPAFPLDLFAGVPEGYFTIWQQNMAGGVPTNLVLQPTNELRFTPYTIESAVSFLKKYVRLSRVNVVAMAMNRLMQEINLKLQRNAWAPYLSALANANNISGQQGIGLLQNVFRSRTAGFFTLTDMNKMFTALRRLNASWVGGSTNEVASLTDLFMSPEVKEQIRGFAYNPVNSQGANVVAGTASSGVVTLPDADREKIFNSAGVDTIFNVSLHELNELGVGYRFNQLFQAVAGANTFSVYGTANSAGTTYDSTASDLVIGIDANKTNAWRAVEVSADSGSEFTLLPDDQFLMRSEKIGWFGQLTEARVILDTRNVIGVIV